jgi:ribosomal protein S18 acetylase RimI-like enzyme
MPQHFDLQLVPGATDTVQRQTLFALYKLLLHPYIEATFGWRESEQQARFETEHPNSAIELIQINTVLAGFVATRLDPNSLHITLLLLKPKFHSQGIGEQVLLRIQSKAKALQLPVTLSCFTRNHRALAFYQRLGYHIINHDENFVDLTNALTTQSH